ncbi:MAG: hypothetical protein P8M12_03665 [Flavobacteriales bacterium]|jgi:hypothetical protein|nr:hypothetical protein [Flavobacteriales bacterium]
MNTTINNYGSLKSLAKEMMKRGNIDEYFYILNKILLSKMPEIKS